MNFGDLCEIFEKTKRTYGHIEKQKLLTDFFKKCRLSVEKEQIFSLMRLILPKCDRERPTYNMKQAKIANVLIKMLALPAGSDKNFLKKSYLTLDQASDFGEVVYSIIRKYLSNRKTTLTMEQLNIYLDKIAKKDTEQKAIEADNILLEIFKKCSAEDSRWIIRIILKDLRLGVGDNTILNCYHKDGAECYASRNNLRNVTETFYDESVKLHEGDIKLFEPFKPMRSKRIDITNFKKELLNQKLFYIENKFDGERFQLHMQNDGFKYFSRNGYDFSKDYGLTYNEGMFTPKLQNVFRPFVRSLILDGEMMLWNKITKQYGSKGMSLDVKKLKEDKAYQPCFCVFDIILLNDEVLTNKPFKERVECLQEVFYEEKPGVIVLSKIKQVDSCREIVDELNSMVANGEEGIIIKDPNSIYKYSDRNRSWFKMKLEYFEGTMNDLDLVVMGGQYTNSSSNQLNSFILGIIAHYNRGKPVFYSFAKVASGLTHEDIKMLSERLKYKGKPFNKNHSSCLVFGKDIPNYYIEPEHSVIFVVRATELQKNRDASYKTSYTLRFPRVLKIREDKPVGDCLNIDELHELTSSTRSVIKLNKDELDYEQLMDYNPPKKVRKREIKVPIFSSSRQISDILEGYGIYVFNGNDDKSMDDIETIIKKAGGKLLFSADDKVDIVLVANFNEKAKNLCKKRRKYDVINVAWLYRVIEDGNLLAYETEEIYCLGTNINNSLSEDVDRYGDSYTKEATVESLKHCFDTMSRLNEVPNYDSLIDVPTKKSFENYLAYFDKYETINDITSQIIYDSTIDEYEFRYYGGDIDDLLTKDTNLIISIGGKARIECLESHLNLIERPDVEIVDKSFIYSGSL